MAILQHQEKECDRLAGTLYAKGLTQEQVGEVVQRHLHLRGTLQQGDPITDDRPPVAGTVAGEWLLPGGVHRRRAHQNPSQTERGHGSLLHDPGGEGGQDPEGAGHLQQAHRERLGLRADAGGPARAGCRQDRPHLRGRPQGAGGGHRRGLSRNQATKLQRCITHLKRNILSDVRNRDKGDVAGDLRHVFRTEGGRDYTVEQVWEEWRRFCAKWSKHYRSFRKRGENASYMAYFTYLNYDHRVQSMIYTPPIG